MSAERCFKPMFRFCAELQYRLDKSDTALTLSEEQEANLCAALGESYYTYLILSDCFCHEVIRIAFINGLFTIERGVDDTDRQHWPCGTSVYYETTQSALEDMQMRARPEREEDCKERFTGEICNGNCTVHFEDGIAVKETPNKRQIPDGEYRHPILKFEDGKVTRAVEGRPDAVMNRGCCG